jgi:hypothetical protein
MADPPDAPTKRTNKTNHMDTASRRSFYLAIDSKSLELALFYAGPRNENESTWRLQARTSPCSKEK